MGKVVAEAGAGVEIMHMQGTPATMQDDPRYDDVVGEIGSYLEERTNQAEAWGIARERICVDPGIGFGKSLEHNLQILAGTHMLAGGQPLMVGASRKGFLGRILDRPEPRDRDIATAGLSAFLATRGVFCLRVHNVAASRDALAPVDAMVRAVP